MKFFLFLVVLLYFLGVASLGESSSIPLQMTMTSSMTSMTTHMMSMTSQMMSEPMTHTTSMMSQTEIPEFPATITTLALAMISALAATIIAKNPNVHSRRQR